MAHTAIDGPLGLEGRHSLRGGDQMPPGANNEFEVFMYGKRRPDLGNYVKIDRIVGIHALGDADDFREPALGRVGEIIYPSAQRGKTLVYEGRVIGTTLPGLRQQAANLRRAAAESRERHDGYLFVVDPAQPALGFGTQVRCVAFEMDDEQAYGPTRLPSPYQRKFTMGLRMQDPRWEWLPVNENLGMALGSTVALNNLGSAPADLIIDVAFDGPLTGHVYLENLTLGRGLLFQDPPMGAGDVLHVVWRQRAAIKPTIVTDPPTYSPNTDMMPYLDLDQSDWWDSMEWGIGPGENELRVTVGSASGDWSVWWSHTSY